MEFGICVDFIDCISPDMGVRAQAMHENDGYFSGRMLFEGEQAHFLMLIWAKQAFASAFDDVRVVERDLNGSGNIRGKTMVGTSQSILALGEWIDQPKVHGNGGQRRGRAPKLEHCGTKNINTVGGAVSALLVETFDIFKSEDHGSAETGVGHFLIVAIRVDLTGGKGTIECAGCPCGFALLFE